MVVAVASTGLLAGAVKAGTATADTSNSAPIHVKGELTAPPATAVGLDCNVAGACIANVASTNTWTGGLTGTSESRDSVAGDVKGNVTFVSFDLFTGHVQGCGDGSIIIQGHITRPFTQPGQGTLEVVKNTGSGGLAKLTGQGTFYVVPDPGGSSATSTYSMTLSCNGQPPEDS